MYPFIGFLSKLYIITDSLSKMYNPKLQMNMSAIGYHGHLRPVSTISGAHWTHTTYVAHNIIEIYTPVEEFVETTRRFIEQPLLVIRICK